MKVHCCLLDKDCRKYGAPARIHLITEKRNIGIALRPSDRFMERRKNAPNFVSYDPKHYKAKWISGVPSKGKGKGRVHT